MTLTTTMMPEYTRPRSEVVDGLAVSTLPTLLLRAVQQVQLRRDPRDFIDLVAIEDALGRDTVDRWATAWLDREAQKSPDVDPARLYETLHYGLSRVMTVTVTEMASHSLGRAEIEAVKDRIVRLARRVAERAPGIEGGPKNGLQRLLSLSGAELAAMRAEAEALGITPDEVEGRVASPAAMAEQRRRAEQVVVVAAAEQRLRMLRPDDGRAHQDGVPGAGIGPSMN
ncbi:hypothetical protein ACFVYG_20220 [Streptomyces sp. NPDC058256]|uniref:hypothetical protein n=1 Tax=Streptomyces sp. NPDC058256 TaxID=3346408 RepID=UPI0036EDA086